ncbi:Aspartate chemoreceptor protein [Tritonibacter multivorans]|uniref:Aspartate chemoreceptor protein n=1 Tax=Tritonibacter multivorans TaxID=928856 RepID=A0A0P1GYN1_9RHOB|nr:methyl-accepting chemotaxis protein [Tritonibacter multivorans]MDA7419954.1 methyl-accepting chemotaxis protein [Tritonibacter multivorans]CUH79392.1 Aspartate chemoreceptor protein [Tritonibacter multivorans]SFC10483.1 methyl-accepting chemotaxis sensory transducer [Tritonibacter multivorans]
MRLRLRIVMALVIAPLFAAAGYFAYNEVLLLRSNWTHAQVVAADTRSEAIVNDFIHEMQKERGYSAGFIASKGKNFPTQLAEQREATDSLLARAQEQVELARANKPTPAGIALENMARIADIRAQVSNFDLTVPQMAKFYTQTISQLLEISRPVAKGDTRMELQQLLQARTLVSAAKERAGLERAMGASGLGGGFSLALHDRYVSLGASQMALLSEANGALGQPDWLQNLMAQEQFQVVSETRKTIRTGYDSGDFGGLKAPDWFKISTNWIDLLRETELGLAAEIEAFSAQIEAESRGDFHTLLVVSIITTIVALVLAVGAFELMIARIKELTRIVDGFSSGDFSIFVKGIDGSDELSKMARAIYRFKQDTLEMHRNAKQLEEDQAKRKEEQDFVVEELRRGLAGLSDGNLTTRFQSPFPEEYEGLRSDFNDTIQQLREALVQVIEAADSIRGGASEITQASDDLSQRTESQAATLEQTAAALEELTVSVKSAADGARTVERTTEDAKQEAVDSGTVVQKAVAAMSEIEESSNHIAQIIGVIDDIAFQTNLLALNAGVEAARAGEAGRGFAVVASEVRALAQRSSDAAMEIKTLIGKSSSQVEHGVELVHKAGDALQSIVERVSHISGLVSEIAKGATEQSSGLEEINTGVVQLDQVTQQNAAMVEQSTAASHMLKSNSEQLGEIVGGFEIGDGQSSARIGQTAETQPAVRKAG